MKPHALLIATLVSLSAPLPAADMPGGHSMKVAEKDVQAHQAKGTLNRINPDGTVNITHGPVQSLGWPGMTMNFRVKDRALLKNLQAGQTVDFEIGKDASGYVIIAVSAAK